MTPPPRDATLTDSITPDQQLLLRAALTAPEPAAIAWRAWRERVVIDDVDGPSQRLLPLMARRLDEVAPDDPLRALIRGMYRHAWVRNQLLIRDATRVVDVMQGRGLPVVILKGAALVRFYGGDWGARPMYDVDMLVPTRRAPDALTVLAELGWVPEAGHTHDWVRWRAIPRHHGWGFEDGDDGQLDLHWHVLATSLGPRADDAFWEASVPLEVGPLRARSLTPADLLLHVLVHGTMSTGPQWVVDAAVVLRDTAGSELAPRLVAQARAHHVLDVVRAALATIVELVGDEAATALLAQVDRAHPSAAERGMHRGDGHGPAMIRQYVRYGGGRPRPFRAAGALIRDRLDLDLARHRSVTIAYALSGKSPFVARTLRRVAGPLARTPAVPSGARGPVDLTDAQSLDRHGGPGWWAVTPDGALTIGTESRLLVPIDDGQGGGTADATLTVELATVSDAGAARVDVLVNDSRVARLDVTGASSTHRIAVPAEVARRYAPVEVALRGAPRGFVPRATRTRLVVRSVALAVERG